MRRQRSHSKSHFCLLFLFVFLWLGLGANSLLAALKFPYLSGHVVDAAGALQPDTKDKLETLLTAHESKTSNQFVVVVLNTLDGYDIADYGYQLGRHWGIGQRDKNNGVLLIIALKDRQVRIEVGYGLEGILTDAKTKSIIEQKIIPQFKQGNLAQGIEEGVKSILESIEGTYVAQDANPTAANIIAFFIILGILIIFWLGFTDGGSNGGSSNGRGGFFGSGRFGGGFGGGGFSGGGGSFGGGGSSGRW